MAKLVTPCVNLCHSAITHDGATGVKADPKAIGMSLGEENTVVDRQDSTTKPSTNRGISIPVCEGSKMTEKSGTEIEEGWCAELVRVSSARLPPGHPCLEYLKGRGYVSGADNESSRFLGDPSPLGGRRWYISVSVKGKVAEFLVDTGASHSMVSRGFYDLVSSGDETLTKRRSARLADGSRLQTYGRRFMKLRIDDKEFAFSPVIADIQDEGIVGLDFAALYGAVLRPKSGVLEIEHPYRLHSQCVLRQVSCIASVVQTVKIPPGQTCDILYQGDGKMKGQVAVMEPDVILLSSIGLESLDTLVANANWSVFPVSNPGTETVYLQKGTKVGKVVLAEAVTGSILDLPVSNLETKSLSKEVEKVLTDTCITDTEQLQKLTNMIKMCSDAFAKEGEPLGRTDKVLHNIDTGDAEPFKIPYRRLPLAKKLVAEVEIEKMLLQGVVVPSTSPWSSPVCMVTKKDGTIRFCIDYRKLNGVTKKNSYPLPRIDETLDSLGGNEWFCTLDLMSGYWQVGMKPEDMEKTAFSSHIGLFQYNVMPFGLCNAPATFEAMMETLLSDILWKRCLVYLDDVIVFGKTFDECLENLRMVLERLISNGLKLKPSKCHLFKKSINYLGRIIEPSGMKADPDKLDAVTNWEKPRGPKDVRSFLGFCSYYREFLPGYSKLSYPMQTLSHWTPGRKSEAFPWGVAQDESFAAVKQLFKETPVLRYPNDFGHFILDTDASNESIGAALSQVQDGVEVPLAFASNTMSKAQRNYCTTKRELLAVIVYTKKFKHFLWGSDFTLRTDHSSLRWLLNFKDAEGMIGRWLAHLSEFGLTHEQIQHRPGVKHINADALSRKPVQKCNNTSCDDCGAHNAIMAGVRLPFDKEIDNMIGWSLSTVKKFQETDGVCKRLLKLLPTGIRPSRPDLSLEGIEMRRFLSQWTELEVRRGCVHRWKTKNNGDKHLQIVIPQAMRRDILYWVHGHDVSGHFGKKRALERLSRKYYWPGMTQDLIRWIAGCPDCCLSKPGPGVGKMPLSQELFGVRFGRIAVDIIGGLKTTPNGNVVMMVVTDYYTKYTRVFPLKDHTAATCAATLVKGWVLHLGVPLMLHSDQGREFEGNIWKAMCEYLCICKTRTNPYRPQSDGQVERFNRTLISVLKPLVNEQMDDWDEKCEFVSHAYNGTVHSTTNCSPNLLVFGEDIIMPVDLVFGVVGMNPELPCHVVFVESLRDKFKYAYELVRIQLQKSAVWQKTGFDTGLKPRHWTVGDEVIRIHQPLVNLKLAKNWDGPFTVIRVISDTTVIIRSLIGRLYKSHVARLRAWRGISLTTEMFGDGIMEIIEEDRLRVLESAPVKRGPGRPRKLKLVEKVIPPVVEKKKIKKKRKKGTKGKTKVPTSLIEDDGERKVIRTATGQPREAQPIAKLKPDGAIGLRRSPRFTTQTIST